MQCTPTKVDELEFFLFDAEGATRAQALAGRAREFAGVDPLADQFAGFTPYHYVHGDPVNLVDPTGMEASRSPIETQRQLLADGEKKRREESVAPEDIITVNAQGTVTNVVKNDLPNTFFDKQGNELTFNDSDIADNIQLSRNFTEGDPLFHAVSISDYAGAIEEAGVEEGGRGPISTARASHAEADFAEGYLAREFSVETGTGAASRRANFTDESGYFRFEGSDVIYNLYDAGNHMWGAG